MYLGAGQWWIFLIYNFYSYQNKRNCGFFFFFFFSSHGSSCGSAVIQCWSCRCETGPGEPQCVSHPGMLLPSSGHWGCPAEGVDRQWPGGHPCSQAAKHMVCQHRPGRQSGVQVGQKSREIILTLVMLNLFLWSIEKYLDFLSFLNTWMEQMRSFHVKKTSAPLFTVDQLISWLLLAWWHKKPGHQQPWYWPSLPGIFWPQPQKALVINTWCILEI